MTGHEPAHIDILDVGQPRAIRDLESRLNAREHRSFPARDLASTSIEDATPAATAPGGRLRRRWVLLAAAALLVTATSAAVLVIVLHDGSASQATTSEGNCPAWAQIKGNVSESGERIFHEPGWRYYDATRAEDCFETAEDAVDAGYRPSQAQ